MRRAIKYTNSNEITLMPKQRVIRVIKDNQSELTIPFYLINRVDFYDSRITIDYRKASKVVFKAQDDVLSVVKSILKKTDLTITEKA